MAKDTKLVLKKEKFTQNSPDILNLSGTTKVFGGIILQSGSTFSFLENRGDNKVLVSDNTGLVSLQDSVEVYEISATLKAELETESNWVDVNGDPIFIPVIMTEGGLKGQRHFHYNWLFECVADGSWIRSNRQVGQVEGVEIETFSTNKTLTNADNKKYLRCTAAADVTITIPVDLALSIVAIFQAGNGKPTPEGATGVTLNGSTTSQGQNKLMIYKQVAPNVYDIIGGE